MQLGRHLAGQHFQVARAKHSRGSAQIAYILQGDRVAFLVDRSFFGQSICFIKGGEIKPLGHHKNTSNKITAAAGNAVRHVMATIAGVGVGT